MSRQWKKPCKSMIGDPNSITRELIANEQAQRRYRSLSYVERRASAIRLAKAKAAEARERKEKYRNKAKDRRVAVKDRQCALASVRDSIPETTPCLQSKRDQYVSSRRNLILGLSRRNQGIRLSSPSDRTLGRAAAVVFSSPVQFTISSSKEHSESPPASEAQISETDPPDETAHGPVRVSMAGGPEFGIPAGRQDLFHPCDHLRREGPALPGQPIPSPVQTPNPATTF